MKDIETIVILFEDRSLLKLKNAVYTPNCNSNLISLYKFYDNNIIYINNFEMIILIQVECLIKYAKYNQNLFILDLAIYNKFMQVIKRKQLINLVIQNKNIRVWY